ncbi:hypothetical protein ERX46_03940 [Brumimicrobium glaciale]|uniref:Uncharacterized protein n=1 Tax=Brumimicrobium glaciale TaxID=200475 RepID=A0A4Q4KMA9_9FLAO|nr:hypothetical protein [Brumimicrobium glaciale]RYM34533.1 hypothetical protein ERX46_03940 [Brumimicrobium glaciale]
MFAFKLLDTAIQGTTFLSSLILLMVFDAEGYFYWINVFLLFWIVISMIFNLIYLKPVHLLRIISTLFLLVLSIIFVASYFTGTTIPRLNFYFKPFSIIIIVFYFFTSMFEMIKLKSRGEVDLDF